MTTCSLRLWLAALLFLAVLAHPAMATDLHIDSAGGNDTTGDGSLSSPWQTLSRLSSVTLLPGDKVLLKRGSIFRERLEILVSGTSANPIVVDAYGTGATPVVSAGRAILQSASWTGPDSAGEYRIALGSSTEYYTSVPVLVRAQPTGVDTYRLLGRGTAGGLADDTYEVLNVSGQRTIVYRPPSGTAPGDFEFEVSKRNFAVSVSGDWVTVKNLEAILGNIGNPTYDSPLSDATMVSLGNHTVFDNCRVAFGRALGLALAGPDGVIDGCLAEHNHSTGLYVQGAAAVRATVAHSISRYNGNLEFQDLDRGGIGVQADDAVIRGNVVHDNGNLLDTTGPRIAGDDAISLFDNHDVVVENNFVYNSARGAIRMSYTADSYGHEIVGNVIANWNLVGLSGTLGTQAISVVGFGSAATAGNVSILNNTIYSDQTGTTLIGIQLALPTNSDYLRDTIVLNNIVYLPGALASDSVGIRLTREQNFDDVIIDYNEVKVASAGVNYSAFAGTFATAAAIYTALGYAEHGKNVDPGFEASPVDPQDPLSFDLATTSPLIDAGTTAGRTVDFIGRAVPSGTAPDIGAFERPVSAPDQDEDGVPDDDDVCPGGPLVVDGFLSPLGPLTPESSPVGTADKAYKRGRTLPLKLRLLCGQTSLTDNDVEPPAIAAILRVGDDGSLVPETALDAGASNDNGSRFRYSGGHWIYNLQTKNLTKGLYLIRIVTPEGLVYQAQFILK